jgi:hypothetical protein
MNDIIIKIPTQKYVYFDDNGNLISVSNTNTEPGNFIQVELFEIENILTGKEQFWHYQVIFDTIKKTYVLKHMFNNEKINLDVNVDVHKITRNKVDRSDLVVIQNIKGKKWQFCLDEAIKENFKTKKIHLDKTLTFSITRYNDPHQLEKFFTMRIVELLVNDYVEFEFESEIELDPTALSVYTTKRLETYLHEVTE